MAGSQSVPTREKTARVSTHDPGPDVIRHADAGHDLAVRIAEARGWRLPMGEG